MPIDVQELAKESNINLLTVLEGLFFGTFDRPKDFKPVDLAITATLILAGAFDDYVTVSLQGLGDACSVSEPTVAASLKRLQSEGWLDIRQGKHKRSRHSILVELGSMPPDRAYL